MGTDYKLSPALLVRRHRMHLPVKSTAACSMHQVSTLIFDCVERRMWLDNRSFVLTPLTFVSSTRIGASSELLLPKPSVKRRADVQSFFSLFRTYRSTRRPVVSLGSITLGNPLFLNVKEMPQCRPWGGTGSTVLM